MLDEEHRDVVVLHQALDLYLWDEPLNYIDVYLRQEIERLVKDNNVTMLFVEHDRSFAESVADMEVQM